MSLNKSDRAIRRVVADLANERIEDVESILGELAVTDRDRIAGLLTAFHGGPAIEVSQPPDVIASARRASVVETLPAWLRGCVEESQTKDGISHADVTMTAATRDAVNRIMNVIAEATTARTGKRVETPEPVRERFHAFLFRRRSGL